jgi:hypothetical protein
VYTYLHMEHTPAVAKVPELAILKRKALSETLDTIKSTAEQKVAQEGAPTTFVVGGKEYPVSNEQERRVAQIQLIRNSAQAVLAEMRVVSQETSHQMAGLSPEERRKIYDKERGAAKIEELLVQYETFILRYAEVATDPEMIKKVESLLHIDGTSLSTGAAHVDADTKYQV